MAAKLAEIRKGYASAYRLATAMTFIAIVVYILALIVFVGGTAASVLVTRSSNAAAMTFLAGFLISVSLGIMGLIMQGFAAALRAIADTAVHTARVLTV